MTLIRPLLSPMRTFEITPAAWTVTTYTDQIPLAENTKKYGRTLASGDFPTFSHPPASVAYIERECVAGSNLNAGAVTIYWKSYKDGVMVASGNQSVSANNYFTVDCSFLNPDIGSVYEVDVWGSSQTNVTITHAISHVSPTRISPTNRIMYDVTETYTNEIGPASGSTVGSNSREYIYSADTAIGSSPVTFTYQARSATTHDGYNIFRYGRGDYSTPDGGSVNTTGTQSFNPRVSVSQIPKITYREIIL